MKDYSNWKVEIDYENESKWVDPNRPWLKHRNAATPPEAKALIFEPIPLHELLKLRVKKYPNNVCIYCTSRDKKYTYRELVNYADRIANALYSAGVRKGDSVGLYTYNIPEFAFCYLGIMATGASVSPINPLLKVSDIEHIINEAGNIKNIIVQKKLYPELIKIKSKGIELENIIVIDANEAPDGAITLEDFIQGKSPTPPDVDFDPINDIAALLWTGGTTNLPKGVMLTHNNLVSNALPAILASEPLSGLLTQACVLPLCHSYGFIVINIHIGLAVQMLMFSKFNAEEVLSAIEFYKIPTFAGVPMMYQRMVNSPVFTERDLSSLTAVGSGSAALPMDIARKWEKIVGIKISNGYGLTETSPGTHGQKLWMPENKPESIGAPNLETDSIIVDPATLDEMQIGSEGELLVRGPQIMKGYWRQPDATARVLIKDKEGKIWLRTGDLAKMDKDGYFYITGRSKQMIKYKGYKIMPVEVENKLYEHPAIREVAVTGVPDPNVGETIKAFVALRDEFKGKVSERDIIEWSKERMAAYKYPRRVEFIDEIPRTSVHKPDRKRLLEMELEKQKK